jgi:sialidase-1
MNLLDSRPLPAWSNLHAWYVADHAAAFDSSSAVVRWGAVHAGSAARDFSRRVSGQVLRNVVSTPGGPRSVLRFDGLSDLWSNATTEFGTLSGPRSVALLCRLRGANDGFLFDGSTNTGRTRAQVRSGSWQAGVTPSGSGIAWNLAEPATATATGGWQRHVFTYTPNTGNTATTVEHWIDGTLVATVSENEVAPLGGMIVGSNGGSPFSRLPVDIAEIAVYSKALAAAEVAQLDRQWSATWGSPTGPPFSAQVTQSSARIPRFGAHVVLEIPISAEQSGSITLDGIELTLREGSPGNVAIWRIHSGSPFNPSSPPLAEIPGGITHWSPDLEFVLQEGTNRLHLVAIPARHAPLGSTIDAAVESLVFSGAQAGAVIPQTPDPDGELTLALVPMFTDVVGSGDLGIHTFRIPGIVCDSTGVLHAVYDHRYSGSGDLPGNIDVGYSRSTDGGATWSVSKVIMDFDASQPNSSGNGIGDPAILHDPNTNTLWAAALWSFGNRAYSGSGPGLLPTETGQYVLVKSTDGGNTWSAPINITAQVKDPAWRLLFVGPGHGITLRDGTLVFPSQMRRDDGLVRMCFVFSRDQGSTWQFGSVIPDTSPQTNENEFLELDDGRLLFSGRTPSGSNGQRAWSHFTPATPAVGVDSLKDGTWSTLYRLPAVPDPVCQATVIQWKSRLAGHPREWLLFANPATGGRNGMTIRLSQDGGLTWPVSRLLYPGSSAYSSLTILQDGSIGLFFERDNYTKITFARVEEAWLMNPEADADNDGMPDSWELLHGLGVNHSGDAALENDGDGANNLEEYLAGTDPQNAASRFRSTGLDLESDETANRMILRFAAVPNRGYAIEGSDDLTVWQNHGSITANRPDMEVEVPIAPGTPRRFLRVRALR